MQVNSVSKQYELPVVEKQPINNTLDMNAFLQLFIAQLKNQDPMSPQDSNAFMAQLAQFSTLEQLTNISKEIGQLRLAQEMSEASALLGKQVKVLTDEGEISGMVDKVKFTGYEVKLYIDGKDYGLYQVTEVSTGE